MFQSTRPVRGATPLSCSRSCPGFVSIHAPRAGRDAGSTHSRLRTTRFNPRAPCGARQIQRRKAAVLVGFNPRAPCGARQNAMARGEILAVSIHAPRAGRDLVSIMIRSSKYGFNPRAPCWARLSFSVLIDGEERFQSTRPVRGATCPT